MTRLCHLLLFSGSICTSYKSLDKLLNLSEWDSFLWGDRRRNDAHVLVASCSRV